MIQRNVCALILILYCGVSQAGIIDPGVFTGTPVNSWAYSELVSAGHGHSLFIK